MKKYVFILLALFFSGSLFSQNVMIRFEGANNSNKTAIRNYSVDVDGRMYYSSNAEVTGTAGARQLTINNLSLGSHKLEVYKINENSTISNTNKGAPVYDNSFQLREGYDMIIAIRRNGQITFTEKKNTATSTVKIAMADAQFEKLLQSTKAKWSQTSRYSSIKSAFTNKTYFFNTDQVGDLLLLITSEPKRLELAKLSYPKVTDPGNFGDVADLFTIAANKENIDKFIRSKNPQGAGNTNTQGSTQVSNDRPVMPSQQFNELLQTIRNQYEQSGKIAIMRDAFKVTNNYFSTAQLRQLLTMITAENERLTLAKLSYGRVADVANFPSLSDLFNSQESRDELNNFIKNGEANTSTGKIIYRTAMSGGEFTKLQLKAQLHIRQSSTVEDLREAFSNKNNYFNLDQIRSLLTMVTAETDRLVLAKLAYHRATDPTTFVQLMDLFTTQPLIDDLNNYIKANKS